MSRRLRIAGGRVYDPANGVDGAVQDVCIDGGRIVAELPLGTINVLRAVGEGGINPFSLALFAILAVVVIAAVIGVQPDRYHRFSDLA